MIGERTQIPQETSLGPAGGAARRRWPWLLAALLLCGGSLLWFAPAIIARTALAPQLLSLAAARLNGRVSLESASLGWLHPVVLRGLVVLDEKDQPLLDIGEVRSEKSLFALLCRPRRAGRFHVEQPCLHCVLTGNSSNLEDAIRKLSGGAQTKSGSLQCTVTVRDGQIEMKSLSQDRSGDLRSAVSAGSETRAERDPGMGSQKDDASEDSWRVERLNGSVVMDSSSAQWLQLQAEGRMHGLSGDAGRVTVEVICGGGQPAAAGGAGGGQVAVQCDTLPLEMAAPWLRRFVSDLSLAGRLSGDCRYTWSENGAQQSVHFPRFAIGDLSLAARQWLNDDQLRIPKLEIRGDVARRGDRLQLNRVILDSDVAKLTLTGEAALADLASGKLSAAVIQAIQNEDYEVAGEMDLAMLAAMLPATLRVRDTVRIDSAKVILSLSSRREGDHRRWSGRMQTTSLSAVNEGRKIEWDHPLEVVIAAQRSPAGLTVEQLACDARFLRLSAQGAPAQGSLSAAADLDQLTADVGRLLDMGDLRLAGKLQGGLSWRQLSPGRLHADGKCNVDDFHFVCRRGDVEGQVKLTATADVAGKRLEVKSAHGELASFHLRTSGVDINEPRVVLEASLNWDQTLRRLDAPTATLVSSTLALRAAGVTFLAGVSGGRRPRLTGDVAFRADLSRLSDYLRGAAAPPTRKWFGAAAGNIRLDHETGVTKAEWSAKLEDLVLAKRRLPGDSAGGVQSVGAVGGDPNWKPVWRERLLSISGKGGFEQAGGKLTLAMLDAAGASHSSRLNLQGEVLDLASRPRADLQGQFEYDLQGVVEQLRLLVGPSLYLAGRDSSRFSLRGPLTAAAAGGKPAAGRDGSGAKASDAWRAPRELAAEARLGWTSASFQGVNLGRGELHGRLAGGILAFDPLDLEFGEGRLTLAPRIDVGVATATLMLDRGPLLQGVRLSPEMCRGWLKYVAPLVADATQAEGRFSLALSGASIPLATPETGQMGGVMTMHEARVGPGPLSQEFLSLARQVKAIVEKRPFSPSQSSGSDTWLTLPAQEIAFHMADGRVYHQGLELTAGDVIIHTQGAVGLDQSLEISAEIPIRDEWVQSDRILALLKGQVIRVPIRGTLSQPSIDRHALNDLARQMLSGAANRLLEDELNRGLRRLFNP